MTARSRARARAIAERRAYRGLGILLAGSLLWVMAFTGGLSSLFGGSTHVLKADFVSIEAIVPNDPVRVHGVQVGTVAATTPDPHGAGGTVTMNLTGGAPAIYNNASAAIVWRTALGANDAIAIDPGTRSAGLLGSRTLPRSQDSNQVELDQITQAFRGAAQTGMRTMIGQLAPAFHESPSVLAGDLATLARIAPPATSGLGALRGAVPDSDLQQLIRQTGQAAAAVTAGNAGGETRRFVESAAHTLSAVSADPSALRASIAGLAQVLTHVRVTAPEIDRTLTELTPLIGQLSSDAPEVAPTLAALHPAVSNLRALLTAATPLLDQLRPAVGSLAQSARIGIPVISALSPSLTRAARTILPGLAEKSPETGRPAYVMLGAAATGLGSLPGVFDSDGHMDDLTAGISVSTLQGAQVLPCSEDFSGEDFLVCSSLSQALGMLTTDGTSLLQTLAGRPGGHGVYGPLLSKAQTLSGRFDSLRAEIADRFPQLAQWLFKPHHGAGS
jgi:ABC-type transporter Mla subunit MlaD